MLHRTTTFIVSFILFAERCLKIVWINDKTRFLIDRLIEFAQCLFTCLIVRLLIENQMHTSVKKFIYLLKSLDLMSNFPYLHKHNFRWTIL